jgi:hypothetical protein
MHLPTRSDLTSPPQSAPVSPQLPMQSNPGVFRRNSSSIAAGTVGAGAACQSRSAILGRNPADNANRVPLLA